MATTTAPVTAAPTVDPDVVRALSRLSRQLGTKERARLLVGLADAIDQGGTTWLILDGPPGEVRSNRLLKGAPLW